MILLDLPDTEYFGSGRVGIHALQDFAKRGPGYFYWRHIAKKIEGPRRHCFDVGRATHKLILEGEEVYDRHIAIQPESYPAEGKKKGEPSVMKPWHNGAGYCKDWNALQEAQGKLVISRQDDMTMKCMRGRVTSNPDAMNLLRRGLPEVVIQQEEEGVPLQCRVDWISADGPSPMLWNALVDLKTCDDLDGFRKDIWNYRYDRQAAWYQWLVQQEIGRILPWFFVAVEKEMPHRVGVYRISDRAAMRAHECNCKDLERLGGYWAKNLWPAGDPEGVQEVDLPRWLQDAYDVGAN